MARGARTRHKISRPFAEIDSLSWSPALRVSTSTMCSRTRPSKADLGMRSPPSAALTVSVRNREIHSCSSHSMPRFFRSSSPLIAWNQSCSMSTQDTRTSSSSSSSSLSGSSSSLSSLRFFFFFFFFRFFGALSLLTMPPMPSSTGFLKMIRKSYLSAVGSKTAASASVG